MYGRYTLRTKLNLLLSEFAADLAPGVEWEPRYNIPPTAGVPAVRLIDGQRQLTLFKWGLVPSWAKDTKIAYSTINARADTVATKPAFRIRRALGGVVRAGRRQATTGVMHDHHDGRQQARRQGPQPDAGYSR